MTLHSKMTSNKINHKISFILIFSSLSVLYCTNPSEISPGANRNKFISKFRHVDYSKICNYHLSLPVLMDSLKIKSSAINILIDKSDYILTLSHDTVIIKQYPVVLGRNPVDDKLRQGDGCTPEGTFKVLAKYGHDKWSKFIWLDYPNKESNLKISQAKKTGLIPFECSPGGEIGIHGVVDGYDYAIDFCINWTAGCISMKNKDINEIYEVVDTTTLIIIRK